MGSSCSASTRIERLSSLCGIGGYSTRRLTHAESERTIRNSAGLARRASSSRLMVSRTSSGCATRPSSTTAGRSPPSMPSTRPPPRRTRTWMLLVVMSTAQTSPISTRLSQTLARTSWQHRVPEADCRTPAGWGDHIGFVDLHSGTTDDGYHRVRCLAGDPDVESGEFDGSTASGYVQGAVNAIPGAVVAVVVGGTGVEGFLPADVVSGRRAVRAAVGPDVDGTAPPA